MSRRRPARYSTVSRRTRHSTVGAPPPARAPMPRPVVPPPSPRPPSRRVAQVMDEAESSLLDVLDNLLEKGVVLNAEVVLALANVDLVYLRLSAVLCAADRVLPRRRR